MENYHKISHSVYDLKYHLVWITKYRKPVIFGDVAIRFRELIREICKSLDIVKPETPTFAGGGFLPGFFTL
jgi:putative transposase